MGNELMSVFVRVPRVYLESRKMLPLSRSLVSALQLFVETVSNTFLRLVYIPHLPSNGLFPYQAVPALS